MRRFLHNRRGYTLVEIAITMLIFGTIIGVVYDVLISSTKSVGRGRMSADMQQNLRVGLDEMLKDVRQAGYGIGQLPAFTKAAKQEIRFWADIDNQSPTEVVRYYLGPTTELANTRNPNDAFLYRQDTSTGGAIPVAKGATQMEFQYYDAAGVALLNGSGSNAEVASNTVVADMNGNGKPDTDDIRSVEITLIIESENPDPNVGFNSGFLQYSLTTKVYPVNLRLLFARPDPDSLLSVTIQPDPAPAILPGDEFQFYAMADYENSGVRDVTDQTFWTSSDTAVATIGSFVPGSLTYNDEGLATGKSVGTSSISCSYDGVSSSNTVLLKVGGPESINVLVNGFKNYTLLDGSATSVTLTAQITDIGYGSSNVIAAQYNVPLMALSGPMAATDGAFDSPTESVNETVSIIGWAPGSTYSLDVRGRSASNPLSWGPEGTASLTIVAADVIGPQVQNLTASPSTTIPEGTPSITITAALNDYPTAASNIAAGEVQVGTLVPAGSGFPMAATDGSFDSPLEAVNYLINTSTWTHSNSPYRIFVIGMDTAGNWGASSFVDIIVTSFDSQGPLVTSISGPGSIASGTLLVTFNGTVDDMTTGGSNIVAVEAFADTDPGTNNGVAMSPSDGAFDSPTEGFSGSIRSFPWTTGSTHTVYARARDDLGNWGPTNSFNVTANSTTNGIDAVVALSNGSFEVWHGNGVGGFRSNDTYITSVSIVDLVVADLNLDGHADVLLGSEQGVVQIWMNDGLGSLGLFPTQVVTISEPVGALVAGDYNRDGALDMIVCSQGSGYVLYYENDGTGALYPSGYLNYNDTHLDNIERMAAADFTGDSFLDVVISGKTGNLSKQEFQVLVHPGAGGGTWLVPTHHHYDVDLGGLGANDYDGDGIVDVVLALNDVTSNGIQVWSGHGNGECEATPIQLWNDVILSLHTMDYDLNGSMDLLIGTAGVSGQEVYVSPNTGSGYFDTVSPYAVFVGVPATAVTSALLDRDSDPDVVSAGSSSGNLFTFLQQPSNQLLKNVNAPFMSAASAVVVRVGEIGN